MCTRGPIIGYQCPFVTFVDDLEVKTASKDLVEDLCLYSDQISFLGSARLKFNRSQFEDMTDPCSRTGVFHAELNKSRYNRHTWLDLTIFPSMWLLLFQASSTAEAGHPLQDSDHLPDLWLHRQGQGWVHEQVEGVLQWQWGHCSHDVRHQLRLQKVNGDDDEDESVVALLMFLAAKQRAAEVDFLAHSLTNDLFSSDAGFS